MPTEWLGQRIEDEVLRDMIAGAKNPFFRRMALPFLAQMQPGDEVWTFCSSGDSWEHLAGREGYALVRDGAAYDHLVTIMS